MPTLAIYNGMGETHGTIEVSAVVFAVPVKGEVVHQVYTAQMANAREPFAHVKDRSEVRGGGRKPWKQKGTGRARHGSIRSPLWSGGGVTFGPRNVRNYHQKVNTKTNRLAVKMCLSAKVAADQLLVVETFHDDGKTKSLAGLRGKLPGAGKSTLLLDAENSMPVRRAAQNLRSVDVRQAVDLNVSDLLHHQYVIATRKAIEVLEQRLGQKK